MKLNLGERFITNNPLRAFIQRHVEGPMLRRMAGFESYPLCLEIGCGGMFGFEEFKDELKNNNVDIINIKHFGNIAIFAAGRKR